MKIYRRQKSGETNKKGRKQEIQIVKNAAVNEKCGNKKSTGMKRNSSAHVKDTNDKCGKI